MRWLFVTAAIAAASLIAIGAAAILFQLQGQQTASSALADIEATIRARGEPVYFSDLAVGREDEFLVGDRVKEILLNFEDMGWSFSDRLEEADDPEDFEFLNKTVNTYRKHLDALAAIESPSECRFRYDFNTPAAQGILIQHVSHVRRSANLWGADFALAMRNNDRERAINALSKMCRTAKFLRNDGFVISQLIRVRIANLFIDSLERFLSEYNFVPADFEPFDQRLAEMEAAFRFEKTLHWERACVNTTLANIAHPKVREQIGMMADFPTGGGMLAPLDSKDAKMDRWASFLYKRQLLVNQKWALEQLTVASQLIDQSGPEAERRWDEITSRITEYIQSKPDSAIYEIVPNLRFRVDGLAYRQRLWATRLAMRVVRFRNVNGKMPKTADEVLDAEFPAVPANLLGSGPVIYTFDDDGFQVGPPKSDWPRHQKPAFKVEWNIDEAD